MKMMRGEGTSGFLNSKFLKSIRLKVVTSTISNGIERLAVRLEAKDERDAEIGTRWMMKDDFSSYDRIRRARERDA